MTGLFSWKFNFFFFLISAFLFSEAIDVVIPCHPKDFPILSECVRGIRKNGKDINRVIVITKNIDRVEVKALAKSLDIELFSEKMFPFNIQKVGIELGCKANRGWFFQQLLKIYAFSVIPDLSSHVLLLDADTVFLNPCKFLTDDGKTLFTTSSQHHDPYFLHAKKLVPTFQENSDRFSGICNFMLIRRDVIERLVNEVEEYHGEPFWKAFLHVVDPEWKHWVGASEYEIYFNYFLANYPSDYSIQELKWSEGLHNIKSLKKHKKDGYHFVTCHHWQRVGK